MSNINGYKDYLKLVRKNAESDLAKAREDAKKYEAYIENWDYIEITKKDDKLSLFKKLLKKFFPKTFKKRMFNEIKSELDRANYFITVIERLIKQVNELVLSFSNDRAIKCVSEFSYLAYTLDIAITLNYITMADAVQIFGSSINFNGTHLKNYDADENIKKLVKAVASYFNPLGDFNGNKDAVLLRNFLEEIINLEQKNNHSDTDADKLEKIKEIIMAINSTYEEYLEEYIPKKAKVELKPIQKPDYRYMQVLNQYYHNGTLLQIPSDLTTFQLLLDNANISEEEQRYIFGLIDAALKKIKTNNESTVPTIDINEVPENNLLFLCDSNGNTYFQNDLDSLDKGIRKSSLAMLFKINSNMRNAFKKVYNSNGKDLLLEIRNKQTHVIFCEINPNIFLIIGTAKAGNKYDEITKRIYLEKNRDHIATLLEALNGDEKEKLLYEHSLLIPDGVARTRKGNHNA